VLKTDHVGMFGDREAHIASHLSLNLAALLQKLFSKLNLNNERPSVIFQIPGVFRKK